MYTRLIIGFFKTFIAPTKYPQVRKHRYEVGSDEVGLTEGESKKIPRGVSPWFFISITFFLLILFPALSFAQDRTNSASPTPAGSVSDNTIDVYAVFWPLVPGKTMEDSLYPLKIFKETIGEWFSFGDIKKAQYNITLSEKRALEAYKLFMDNKDYNNGPKTLDVNQKLLKRTFDLIKKAEKDQKRVDGVKGKFTSSLENQQKLFKLIQSQVPDDQKGKFDKALENINSRLILLP